MSRPHSLPGRIPATLLVLAAAYLNACSDDLTRNQDHVVPLGPVPRSNILLSPPCSHTNSGLYFGDVVAKCNELQGTATTITMAPPPTTPVPVQYSCLGWGNPPAPYNPLEWYAAADGHPFSIFSNRTTYATVQVVDAGTYVFQVTPKHPTDGSLSPPLRISCTIDPIVGVNSAGTITIAVNGTVPVALTQITLAVPAPWVRPPTTMTITPSFKDNYNGTDLIVPTPTTIWTSSNTAAATVSGGIVTGLARGSFTVTAASGGINATSGVITVQGCTSIGLSPSGTQNLSAGGSVNITATPTCDPYIVAGSEPVVWSTSNASVATVSGSGTGNHIGHVTAVAAGSATVKACATLPPLPPGGLCSASVSINVVQQPTLSSVTTTPSPAVQYTPFTLTINGSGFDPATAQIVYSQPCYPTGSWCSATYLNSDITTKTPTQLIITNRVFSIPGPIRIQVRNGASGTLSNFMTITIVPLY